MSHPRSVTDIRLVRALDRRSGPEAIEGTFSEGLAQCRGASYTYGFIDRHGEVRIQPMYKDAAPFYGGVAFVEDDTGWFLINPDGERLSDESWSEMPLLREGILCFSEGGRCGFRTLECEIIAEPRFERALPFTSGFAAVEENGRTGFIDRSGRMAVPAIYDQLIFSRIGANVFSEGLAAVSLDGRFGYIDAEHGFVLPPRFHDASLFRDGIATVAADDGKTAMHRTGDFLFAPVKADIGLFFGGLAGFKPNRWVEYSGVMNTAGAVVLSQYGEAGGIPPHRYRNRDFSQRRIPFSRGGKWGFVDADGCERIAPCFDEVMNFEACGYASVQKEGRWGLIDRQGDALLECRYLYPIGYDGGDRVTAEDEDRISIYEIFVVDEKKENGKSRM